MTFLFPGNVIDTRIISGLDESCNGSCEASKIIKIYSSKNPRKLKLTFHKTIRIHFHSSHSRNKRLRVHRNILIIIILFLHWHLRNQKKLPCSPIASQCTMLQRNKDSIKNTFNRIFGSEEFYCFAPGRANIIGEHIDYHGGTVIPFAIDMGIHFLPNILKTNTTRILSIDLDEEYIYDPNQPPSGWKRFFYDTVSQLQPPKAVQIGFGGNLPIGAGLSSSSALVCGIVQLFDIILGFSSTKEALLNKAIQIEKGNASKRRYHGSNRHIFSLRHSMPWRSIVVTALENISPFL